MFVNKIFAFLLTTFALADPSYSFSISRHGKSNKSAVKSRSNVNGIPEAPGVGDGDGIGVDTQPNRRAILSKSAAAIIGTLPISVVPPPPAYAKCTDIESCREVGERKIEEDLKLNPIVRLDSGTRYRVIRPPTVSSSSSAGKVVTDGSSIDLAFSISSGSGQYMYSKGFGYEKIEFGGKQESDLGLDSIRAVIGKHDIPIGIEEALMGMGRGERRRVELPAGPNVGFESSNWQPAPTTRRGKVQMEQYRKKLTGFGSQPPFPAETVWDVEVLAIR